MSGKVAITLTGAPRSRNVTDAKHWRVRAQERAIWKDAIGWELRASAMPHPVERVHARAVLAFPTRRRRDEGNYRYALEKALGDALVAIGYLPDDTPDRFTFGDVTFAKAPVTQTTLTIEWSAG